MFYPNGDGTAVVGRQLLGLFFYILRDYEISARRINVDERPPDKSELRSPKSSLVRARQVQIVRNRFKSNR